MSSPPTQGVPRRARPCDACRRRKRRCVIQPGQTICVLCQFYGAESCTFVEDPSRHSRKRAPEDSLQIGAPRKLAKNGTSPVLNDDAPIRTVRPIEDYDALPGPSILKQNLGLQQHRFSRYVGPSDELDIRLFDCCEFDTNDEYRFPNRSSIRRVSSDALVVLTAYSGTRTRTEELDQLDVIEKVVAPHGQSLVNLYFRIVHPSYPILHKKTFLDKYTRTHREFSPPCLAGVYILALEWWNYDRELSSQEKPDVEALVALAGTTIQDVMSRPKLSTLQGGLLLLQHRPSGGGVWALTSQMVATMQELGVHLDCEDWRIPDWEKGLRRRLAWSIYMLDKWMALTHGRPSHIVDDEWTVQKLTDADFPENSADEDDLDGSAEVETGRVSFEWMITLSQILSDIIRTFYTPKAIKASEDISQLLQQAKPIQIRLREWYKNLPDSLHMDSTKARKISSNGSLHLAYYATEITLHRAIIMSFTRGSCDPAIIEICLNAARTRVTAATDFVRKLKVEQLQSFWYFPSGINLVYIGTFAALLYLTSRSLDEALFYKQLLDDYRWILRVNSRSVSFIDFAVQRLDVSLSHLDQISPQDIVGGTPLSATISPNTFEQDREAPSEQYSDSPDNSNVETIGLTSMVDTVLSPHRVNFNLLDEGFDFLSQDWTQVSFPE